ncbi:hypothetical protein ACU9CW_001571 [Cronobacter dublinensis]
MVITEHSDASISYRLGITIALRFDVLIHWSFCSPHPKPISFGICSRFVSAPSKLKSDANLFRLAASVLLMGLSITASGFIVNTAGDKKSQAVLMLMIYKIIYFFAHISYIRMCRNPL